VTTSRTSTRGQGYSGRSLVALVCTITLCLLVGACGGAAQNDSKPSGQTQSLKSTDHSHAAAVAAAPTSPMEASLQLQALLGQHSVLSAEMMRGRLRGDPDFAQAANAALGNNTDAMGQLVEALYGKQAATQFASLWSTHITLLFNYARGLADQNEAVRGESRTALDAYESNLAAFLSKASEGRLPHAAVESALRTHVDHLLQQADAYAAKDYARANQIYREAYAHTYALGKTLAVGLFGPAASKELATPKWQLRSELGKLLGEHLALVVAATRAGAVSAPDFTSAADAVNGNTRDLAGAIDSLYGAAAAKGFQALWANHVDNLVAYSAGVAGRDQQRRENALAKLNKFEHDFAGFLDTATGGRLASAALAEAFLMHDRMLLQQVDAFAAKNYPKAHDITYSAYQQMVELAGQLADAIGATIAARLPKGGMQTGEGGMAPVVERR
jgi:hypothetical protein